MAWDRANCRSATTRRRAATAAPRAPRRILRPHQCVSALNLLLSSPASLQLDALAGLPHLGSLIAAGNRLSKTEQLAPLAQLPSLFSLDLSKARRPSPPLLLSPPLVTRLLNACSSNTLAVVPDACLPGPPTGKRVSSPDNARPPATRPRPRRQQNQLEGAEAVSFVAALRLSYLKLQGNPCVAAVPHFRKVVIDAMPALNYLDEAPVRGRDRRLAAAFARGGFEAEREERERLRAEEAEEAERNRREFDRMVEARVGRLPPLFVPPSAPLPPSVSSPTRRRALSFLQLSRRAPPAPRGPPSRRRRGRTRCPRTRTLGCGSSRRRRSKRSACWRAGCGSGRWRR